MKKENDREKITQRDKKNNVKWGKRKTKKTKWQKEINTNNWQIIKRKKIKIIIKKKWLQEEEKNCHMRKKNLSIKMH